jgi:hypothetical protein
VRLLLVPDDDRARLRGFEEIASRLGDDWIVKGWRDAPTMLAEIDRYLDAAGLISLGSGRLVADYLCKRKPACPVIVHTTNTDAAWGMHNVLRSAGWTVELVHHLSQPKWIEEVWLPVAKRLVFGHLARRVLPMGPVLTLMEYRALLKSLPVPTPDQMRNFAEYVANAHSWYKHLRLLPVETPIQIYLDPAAGMQLAQGRDGRVTAQIREEQGFHYSWLRTAEHRERFGYLAFSKSGGTSVSLLNRDGSQLVPSDDAPCVYDPEARTFYQLPEEAVMAGRAFISAIVHKIGDWTYLWESLIGRNERFDQLLYNYDGLEITKRILDRCAVLKKDPAAAEPSKEEVPEWKKGLPHFDLPLSRLVEAERLRQTDGLAAAAARVVRLAGSREPGPAPSRR